MRIVVGCNNGCSNPLVSPPLNARGGIVPQEPPNGRWSIPNLGWGTFVPSFVTLIIPPTRKHLLYLIYVKDIDLDVQIQVFKKVIKVNGKIINEYIISLFGFTLQNNVFEWGENFLHDHPNCILQNWNKLFVNVTK